VAWAIGRRSFLPGTETSWVEQRRTSLRAALVRALECRSFIYLQNDEFALAAQSARDAIAAEPFRESSYCLLMQAEAAAGNKAEAVRVYEQCRRLIRDELGVTPSRDTLTILRTVLQGTD
jgi:DNA-binding SARP family transcriptional activator